MDLLSLPVLPADHRIPYGPLPTQFGDLWIPEANAAKPWPLVVFFHGGWWKSEYDLGYGGYLCRALKLQGMAVWSVEYRRLGATGGGWPTTFQDASAGFEHVAVLARTYPLDLKRVITMGHSAGGHLAFWIAGRSHITPGSILLPSAPSLAPMGTIALAGAVDLQACLRLSSNPAFAHVRDRVTAFMGGSPADRPDRYRDGDPGGLIPLPMKQVLIQGTEDDQIPAALPRQWVSASRAIGGVAEMTMVAGADHFDVVDPRSGAWREVAHHTHHMLHAPE